VSITQQQLFHWGKSPQYLTDRLGRFQSRSGNCGEEKKLFPLLGMKPEYLYYLACSPVTIPHMDLFKLQKHH
jgi:hypothetical protein